MGKKAAKGKKAGKGKKEKEEAPAEPTEWDAKTIAEITEDKKALLERLEESRVQRNYYQQERVRVTGDYGRGHQCRLTALEGLGFHC